MRGTAATRVKKPRPRTAGVSATEHGRAQANPDLSWTGDETKGFLARGFVNDDEPIAYTVTPVNVLGSGSQFEANIVTTRNFDFNLRVKQLAARYGKSLHTPVPTVAEAK